MDNRMNGKKENSHYPSILSIRVGTKSVMKLEEKQNPILLATVLIILVLVMH